MIAKSATIFPCEDDVLSTDSVLSFSHAAAPYSTKV